MSTEQTSKNIFVNRIIDFSYDYNFVTLTSIHQKIRAVVSVLEKWYKSNRYANWKMIQTSLYD